MVYRVRGFRVQSIFACPTSSGKKLYIMVAGVWGEEPIHLLVGRKETERRGSQAPPHPGHASRDLVPPTESLRAKKPKWEQKPLKKATGEQGLCLSPVVSSLRATPKCLFCCRPALTTGEGSLVKEEVQPQLQCGRSCSVGAAAV